MLTTILIAVIVAVPINLALSYVLDVISRRHWARAAARNHEHMDGMLRDVSVQLRALQRAVLPAVKTQHPDLAAREVTPALVSEALQRLLSRRPDELTLLPPDPDSFAAQMKRRNSTKETQ